MMKYTRGPWTLETVKTSCGVCHKVGKFPSANGVRKTTYGCVYEDGLHWHRLIDDMDTELLANARLMATAPELLGALRDLCDAIPAETIAADPPLGAWEQVARAVIAKAEGR